MGILQPEVDLRHGQACFDPKEATPSTPTRPDRDGALCSSRRLRHESKQDLVDTARAKRYKIGESSRTA